MCPLFPAARPLLVSLLMLVIGSHFSIVTAIEVDPELEAWFDAGAQEAFAAASALGSERLMSAAGGVKVGERWFPPGTDVMETLGRESKQAMRELYGEAPPPQVFRGSSGVLDADRGVRFELRHSLQERDAKSVFPDRKAKVLSELSQLIDYFVLQNGVSSPENQSDVMGKSLDYIPSIQSLLSRPAAVIEERVSAPIDSQETSGLALQDVSEWIANRKIALDHQSPSALLGFIDNSLLPACEVISPSGAKIALGDLAPLSARPGGDQVPFDQAEQQAKVVLRVASETFFDDIRECVIAALAEIDTIRGVRQGSYRPNSQFVYGWAFSQLMSPLGSFVPLADVSYRAARLRIAIAGRPASKDKTVAIDIRRILLVTTPLPSQSDFIIQNKGLPATLIEASGHWQTAYVQCEIFGTSKDRWLSVCPAIKAVNDRPDEYLRSLLVSSRADLDILNEQLRAEVTKVTSDAVEAVLVESRVKKDLRLSGYDKDRIQATARLVANGLGSQVIRQVVSLFCEPHYGRNRVIELAKLRARMAGYLKDRQLASFVEENLINSFLVFSVDQSGVCLCDFPSALSIHMAYASALRGLPDEDYLAAACRVAEIRNWVAVSRYGMEVVRRPPFSDLPKVDSARVQFFERLCEGYERVDPYVQGPDKAGPVNSPADSVGGSFVFPGRSREESARGE